ncbi:hypothetical protein G7Y89_g15574 [Cudoniella acicularis]|uniref:AMP-dependent synthetase/ligase domain-containing protein n=1 Tax=Cudoniella acicularis TaxID=354080 RepID=A0A8H4QK61_9HELO|nr:hypothetical protein G7Y89_g15574 [Cudoniella acicularis]
MMAPVLNVLRKRSVAEMQHPDAGEPLEYRERDYAREVLQLADSQTEALVDDALVREAETLGITVPRPATAKTDQYGGENENSISESALTVVSHHARTASSASQGSNSTSLTSRSSIDFCVLDAPRPPCKKRPTSRRSLSFSEYEKYLAQAEAQDKAHTGFVPPPLPTEPAPSLFSVSTKKSYASIKKGLKSRLRFCRTNSSMGIRTLVELTQGCSHITCRCKAQFCYICGAIWDPVVGCPNFCNGEEELERRRLEEEARLAELEKEKAEREAAERAEAAEKLEAEKRTRQCRELNALRSHQINERDRFISFERKMKWMMWTRHGQAKLDMLDRYGELLNKMKERHIKTAAHLEDRQVAAEMELRASHKQAKRSVQIRLRHMEAYCDGLGRSASGANPARVVTERDLRELGQQYNLRDDLERLHQSRVNVMREKQAKQMEQLLSRQESELEKLAAKQEEELEALEESFVTEEDGFFSLFQQRRSRLRRRWNIYEEIMRKNLEANKNVKFAPMTPVEWQNEESDQDDGLEAVTEIWTPTLFEIYFNLKAVGGFLSVVVYIPKFGKRVQVAFEGCIAIANFSIAFLKIVFTPNIITDMSKTQQFHSSSSEDKLSEIGWPERTAPAREIPFEIVSTPPFIRIEIQDEDPDRWDKTTPSATISFGTGLRQHLSFKKNDVLAVLTQNCIDTPAITWGTHFAGGIVSPANPAYTARELAHHLKDSGAKILVTQKHLLRNALKAAKEAGIAKNSILLIGDEKEGAEGCRHFSEILTEEGRAEDREKIDCEKDLSFLTYSSGTTGLPKGVMLSHLNVVSDLFMVNYVEGKLLNWERDKVLAVLPYFHIYGTFSSRYSFSSEFSAS